MYGQIRFKQTEIGKIPEDWEVEELKNVLEEKGYVRGPFGSALRRNELKTEGIPVYEQEHAIYNSRKFRYHIDENKFRELSRFLVKEDDLIISCSGTLGKVSMISKTDPKGIISQALLLLRPNINKILPRYLKYFFYSPKGFDALVSRSSGSVQVNLAKREVIETIKLALPAITEQSHIVKILSDLDSKIALNHQTNRTLEAIGQALFKRWFIDFEFPNEEGKPYKSSGGEMVYSQELEKEIPKGWSVKPVNGLASINGSVLSNNDPLEYIDYIEISQVSKGSVNGISRYARGHEPSRAKRKLRHGDSVLSTVRPDRGSYFLCLEPGPNLIASTGFAVVTPKIVPWSFLYLALTQKDIGEYLGRMADGGAYPSIRPDVIGNLDVIISTEEILIRFDSIVSRLLMQCHNLQQQNMVLENIRDTLLPLLISGDIQVDPSRFGLGPEGEKVGEV